MRKVLFAISFIICHLSLCKAQVHHDWEDNHVLQVNREPARAYFIPYGVNKGDRMLCLNGDWKFRWTKTPDEMIMDFYQTSLGGQRLWYADIRLGWLSV